MKFRRFYCRHCGTHHERLFRKIDRKRVKCTCGRYAERYFGARVQPGGTWPRESEACGFNPNQTEEVREFIQKKRLRGVDINPTNGNLCFSTRRAQRDYLRATGLIDRDGGYSD